MDEILLFATVLAPVIIALTELVKRSYELEKRFIPLIALVIGLVVGGLATNFGDIDLVTRLWAGGIAGLSASGLFKLATKKDKEEKGS